MRKITTIADAAGAPLLPSEAIDLIVEQVVNAGSAPGQDQDEVRDMIDLACRMVAAQVQALAATEGTALSFRLRDDLRCVTGLAPMGTLPAAANDPSDAPPTPAAAAARD